jgi:dienelactone hydrolase
VKIRHFSLILVPVLIASVALSACNTDRHCPDQSGWNGSSWGGTPFDPGLHSWWGTSNAQGAHLTDARGDSIPLTVFAPDDAAVHPAIVVLHGAALTECHQWWSAKALAGHGFVTITPSYPTNSPDVVSVINFLLSDNDPFVSQVDPNHIGIMGHSAGAGFSEAFQATDTRIKAMVAYDNLVADADTADGDPSALVHCDPTVVEPFTPRVPALGFASDTTCSDAPNNMPRDLKLSGFDLWQSKGVPTGEMVMGGATHLDFDGNGDPIQTGFNLQAFHQQVFDATLDWFDAYLAGDTTALGALNTWAHQSGLLAARFASAIAVPGDTCLDLATC